QVLPRSRDFRGRGKRNTGGSGSLAGAYAGYVFRSGVGSGVTPTVAFVIHDEGNFLIAQLAAKGGHGQAVFGAVDGAALGSREDHADVIGRVIICDDRITGQRREDAWHS